MELRQLRHFAVLAETLHFGRAAERLHVTPSALSQSVRRLEREVGVPLLHRTSRRVGLTRAGEVLLRHTRSVQDAAVEALAAARRAAREEAGRVAVGFACNLAASLLPGVVAELAQRAPGLRLDVHQTGDGDAGSAVLDHDVDVAFGRPPVVGTGLEVDVVLVEPVAVALPGTHPLAGRAGVDLGELAGEGWILMSPDSSPTRHADVLARCAASGFAPRVAHESPSLQVNLGLAAAGHGVFPLPLSAGATAPPGTALVPVRGWSTQVVALRRGVDAARSRAVVDAARTVASREEQRTAVGGGRPR